MRVAACLLAILVAAPIAARGDEIGDQLDQARRYYEAGDLAGAVSELEFVLQALRGRVSEALAATFPGAPEGAAGAGGADGAMGEADGPDDGEPIGDSDDFEGGGPETDGSTSNDEQ